MKKYLILAGLLLLIPFFVYGDFPCPPWYPDSVTITGGSISGTTIDNSVIGGTTPAAGSFTTLEAGRTILSDTTLSFTTDGNFTDPLASSVYLLDGDDDGENDTISLKDGETAGQVLYLIAAVDIDANDTCTIGMTLTTCTNCPAIVFNKIGENAHLIWTGSTWVVISLQDAL